MKDLLIYYGYLNSFNSATNSWDNDNVIADISGKYNVCVFGDGVQDKDHPDYANSTYIINGLKANGVKIYGYVSVNQDLSDFMKKASQWDTMGVDGIFFDEAGYDFGKTRDELNERIGFVKEMNFATSVFVNSWDVNHIIGIEDDFSFPNTTYNPSLVESLLTADDLYLLENFGVSNGSYETLPQWLDRGYAATSKPLKVYAVSVIDDADPNAQGKFDRAYRASYLWKLEGFGSSSNGYGASSAQVNYWTRPDITNMP